MWQQSARWRQGCCGIGRCPDSRRGPCVARPQGLPRPVPVGNEAGRSREPGAGSEPPKIAAGDARIEPARGRLVYAALPFSLVADDSSSSGASAVGDAGLLERLAGERCVACGRDDGQLVRVVDRRTLRGARSRYGSPVSSSRIPHRPWAAPLRGHRRTRSRCDKTLRRGRSVTGDL